MSKIALVEFDYENHFRDSTASNYIKSARIELIEPQNITRMQIFSYPKIPHSQRPRRENTDDQISVNERIENVTKEIRNFLKGAVEVVLFQSSDRKYIQYFLDNENIDIRVLE